MARRYTKPSIVNAPLRAARVLKSTWYAINIDTNIDIDIDIAMHPFYFIPRMFSHVFASYLSFLVFFCFVFGSLSSLFVVFALFFVFKVSLKFCRCSSNIFLSSRPRTGLATAYITGYG